MGFPIVPFGIAMLGTALGAGSVKKPNMIDPRAYADDLLYGDADIAGDLSAAQENLQKGAGRQISEIKRYGAANRLPEGAVMSKVAGTTKGIAEGVGKALPGLRREKRQSQSNFLNMVNRYESAMAGYDQAGIDRTLSGLGNLGKIATLWSAGYLS